MIAVTGLGLAAAFLFALSALLQQRAARTVVGSDTASLHDAAGVIRLLRRLVRSRTWLTGWLTNIGGVVTQAAALKVGSVAAVQPLMAAQLLFALTLASGKQRRWPSVRDWLAALAVCAGLVLLLVADASPLNGAPHRHRVHPGVHLNALPMRHFNDVSQGIERRIIRSVFDGWLQRLQVVRVATATDLHDERVEMVRLRFCHQLVRFLRGAYTGIEAVHPKGAKLTGLTQARRTNKK